MPQQHSVTTGGGWQGDPEHAPEAMEALRIGGTEAFRAVVARLTRARAAEQAERSAQHAVLWRTRSGEPLVDGSAGPVPAPQRAVVRTTVPGLATEDRPDWKD